MRQQRETHHDRAILPKVRFTLFGKKHRSVSITRRMLSSLHHLTLRFYVVVDLSLRPPGSRQLDHDARGKMPEN